MSPFAQGRALQDLLLAEAVKDLEADTPLRDDAALAEALAAGGGREAMLVVRARRLAAETGLRDDVDGAVQRVLIAGAALGLLGILLAGTLVVSLLGEGRRINALAAMVVMLVPNAVGILAWALFAARGGRGGVGLFTRTAVWLGQQRWSGVRLRRIWPALARLLEARGLIAWVLGVLNHTLWCWVYVGAGIGLLAVLSFAEYRLGFETTILAQQTLTDIARLLAWWPQQLGLPARIADVASPAEASQRLGLWLISGVLAYGALPRMLLALLCLGVMHRRTRDLHLDLADPYNRRVLARLGALAPTRVLDHEHAAAVPAHDSDSASAATGPFVVLGFELPAELPLPPELLERAAWSERVDGGLDEREALLHRLAAQPPAQLLIVGHAPSTPDRGTLRFLEAARAGRTALLLPAADATALARWRDWLTASGRGDITVFGDTREAQAWR